MATNERSRGGLRVVYSGHKPVRNQVNGAKVRFVKEVKIWPRLKVHKEFINIR